MNTETWQRLLSLESHDITQQWFRRIHSRDLSARRAREINAAAKQGREFFRNASNSNYSVRPLLTFYGVACLSRALLLLMRTNGGEEGLTAGHGLETVGWGDVMSGDKLLSLRKLHNLKIRTRQGLFSDFVEHTGNIIMIHVHSAGVDWRIPYDIPELGKEFSLKDLLSRMPDLRMDYSNISGEMKYAPINEMTYDIEKGLNAKVKAEDFARFQNVYEGFGYIVSPDSDWVNLTCDSKTFNQNKARGCLKTISTSKA